MGCICGGYIFIDIKILDLIVIGADGVVWFFVLDAQLYGYLSYRDYKGYGLLVYECNVVSAIYVLYRLYMFIRFLGYVNKKN